MTENGTILIVDDQPSARKVLQGLLTGQGYRLTFAASGAEALTQAAELNPDLILLDVMMPDMDGFEVCRRLQANHLLSEIPIIMVTALDDRDSRLRGFKLGIDDFITKPFDHTELRVRVRTLTRLNRQRRQHLQELQAERDRTQAILETLGEAVIVTNTAGIVQYLNPAAVTLTGYTIAESLGQNWRMWLNEETASSLNDEILSKVSSGQTWRGEIIGQRKEGDFYDAALTVAPLFTPHNAKHPLEFVSVLSDITPLKKAERAKTDFVSNVSHELRTPLSVLTLVSDNLDTLYQRLDDGQRRKMIKDIQKHTKILNELIGDVLEISRIDSGYVSMEREPVNLIQLVQTEVEEILPLAQQKSQNLQLSKSDPLDVLGNSEQLRQVIRNLLNNAIKYTPANGNIYCECLLLVSPHPDDYQSWPGSANLTAGEWAGFRVVDTGIGISRENLANIFERFYRVKAQRTVRGTGLGLAIARNLINLHGGHIAVNSSPDQGSTFAVYLPLLGRDKTSL